LLCRLNNIRYILITGLIFLVVEFSHSQSPERKIVLSTYIQQIESSSALIFNYADDIILDNLIIPSSESLDSKGYANYLTSQTGLVFQALDAYTILIIPKKSPTNDTQLLDPVFISNILTQGVFVNSDGSTNITPSDFGILAGLTDIDVMQIVQNLPGISSVNEKLSDLNIRGGTQDQNLILWNGIKMYQSGHLFGLLSAINSNATQKVTVLKNGSSAFYGDGVSGTIDMSSDFSLIKKPTFDLGSNLISADVHSIVPLSSRQSLQLSARRSITDAVQTPPFKNYFNRLSQNTDLTTLDNEELFKNERFYFYDLSLNYLYEISKKERFQFNTIYIQNALSFDEDLPSASGTRQLNSSLKQKTVGASASYFKQLSPDLNLSGFLYLSRYTMEGVNNDLANEQRLIQNNSVEEKGLKLKLDYNINPRFNFKMGYQLNETGVGNLEDINAPLFRRYIKEVIISNSLINELSFISKDTKTSFNTGLRTNYIDKFSKFIVEPRLSVSHQLSKKWQLEILAEKKSQYVSQAVYFQNDFLGIEKRRWKLSNNSSIPIVQSSQVSLGLHYNKNNWLFSMDSYYKKVNGITTRSQGFQNQYQFVDAIGLYEVKGIDFLVQKKWSVFTSWLTYSLSQNEYDFKALNSQTNFPNNYSVEHAFSWSINHSFNSFKYALSVNGHSGKPYTLPSQVGVVDSTIEYATPNAVNLPDYLRVDLSLRYDFKLQSALDASLSLSIWNLLNRTNVLNRFYSFETSNQIMERNSEALGLTPNLSFRLRF
jgi:outer membrane cobalamin receptor